MISLYKPSIYDALSRLVSADYSEGTVQASANARAGGFIGGGGIIGGEIASGGHSESYHYDRNGNMDLHGRNNMMEMIGIEGNRITSVGTKAISYDAKGRQVSSAYGKAVATQYNILDLPQKHTLSSADTEIDYKYSADGRKLQEKVTQGSSQTSRDYIGEFIYENGTLKKILFDGGYVDMIGDSPVYMFFIKDHLGSVRAVVSETGAVQQTNDYYPFGDLFSSAGTADNSSDNSYRFTGKELGDETGLYDFSARYLQTSLGRFTTIDPLAEKSSSISPYIYCNSNPVNRIDLDGRIDWKLTREGIFTTISGIGAIAGGSGLTAASGGFAAGVGGFMIANGIVSIGVGVSMITIGLTTDPSEKNDEIMENLPSDTINAVAKSVDHIMKNENNEVENAVSSMTFAYDIMNLRVDKIRNVQDALEATGNIFGISSYVWDMYDSFSESQATEESNKSQMH